MNNITHGMGVLNVSQLKWLKVFLQALIETLRWHITYTVHYYLIYIIFFSLYSLNYDPVLQSTMYW